MFIKLWYTETDPCEALARDIFHDRSCGDYQSDVRDVEDAVNNLRDIVQAMFARLDLNAQIEILTALGWKQK